MDYEPIGLGNFDAGLIEVRTSQEIVGDLAEMVDIGLNEVAESMLWLGYRTVRSEGKTGWMLRRRSV